MNPPTNHTKQIIPIITAVLLLFAALLFTDPTITGFVTNATDTISTPENTTINETANITETNTTEQNTTTNETTNLEPIQTQTIPNQTINETTTLNLNDYFEDPEQEQLYYDISNPQNLNVTINQTQLIINPVSGTIQIYASDGENTITSNEISIVTATQNETSTTINQTTETNTTTNETDQSTTTETNTTINQTTETNTTTNENSDNETTRPETNETTTTETNTTINQTTETNETLNTTTNETDQSTTTEPIVPSTEHTCDNPDPNLRPIECLEQNIQDHYDLENILITNNDRIPVARVNPVGNILITGELIENSNSEPEPEDFKVTTLNQYYEESLIAFIDTDTGNFHIKGNLYEEDFFLKPTEGAYIIQNKRNVNLAYIDVNTGDLHIKNNLIQNRETIQ